MKHLVVSKSYREEVKKIVGTITKGYKPEKIFVFGSAATGRLRPNSDIDLLIIKKTKKKYFDRVREIALMLDTQVSTDIFVLTPQELDEAISENRFFIVEEVLPKGKLVYEKA